MSKLIYFQDGNGFIDTHNRAIGRWVWRDDKPYAQWILQSAYLWTVTELYGAQGDEWDVIYKISYPNPNTRTVEQRIADELYWKRVCPNQWAAARSNLKVA